MRSEDLANKAPTEAYFCAICSARQSEGLAPDARCVARFGLRNGIAQASPADIAEVLKRFTADEWADLTAALRAQRFGSGWAKLWADLTAVLSAELAALSDGADDAP